MVCRSTGDATMLGLRGARCQVSVQCGYRLAAFAGFFSIVTRTQLRMSPSAAIREPLALRWPVWELMPRAAVLQRFAGAA